MRLIAQAKASAALLALILAISACAGSDEPADVAITGFSYEPETLGISAGDTVAWTNDDVFAHTVTDAEAEDGGREFDGELGDLDTVEAEGTTFTRTFDEPGADEYFCRFHPDMRGTVVVTDG